MVLELMLHIALTTVMVCRWLLLLLMIGIVADFFGLVVIGRCPQEVVGFEGRKDHATILLLLCRCYRQDRRWMSS